MYDILELNKKLLKAWIDLGNDPKDYVKVDAITVCEGYLYAKYDYHLFKTKGNKKTLSILFL